MRAETKYFGLVGHRTDREITFYAYPRLDKPLTRGVFRFNDQASCAERLKSIRGTLQIPSAPDATASTPTLTLNELHVLDSLVALAHGDFPAWAEDVGPNDLEKTVEGEKPAGQTYKLSRRQGDSRPFNDSEVLEKLSANQKAHCGRFIRGVSLTEDKTLFDTLVAQIEATLPSGPTEPFGSWAKDSSLFIPE